MSWKQACLHDVCHIGPRDAALAEASPFVPMANVEVGRRYPVTYEARGTRGGIRAQAGDILFARITPCLENGKVAQIPPQSPPTGGSTEFIVIRPGPQVDPGFVYYWTLSPAVRSQAEANMTGTTGRMRLAGKDLANFGIAYPDVEEQRRIVDFLEDHLSRLDAAESSLRFALRKADAMVTASLDRQTTAGHRAWRHMTIGEKAALVEYGSSAKCGAQAADFDVPVLRMGNIQNGSINWNGLKFLPPDHQQFPKLLLQAGDLIFNRTNSAELVGKSAVFDGTRVASFASYLIRVRFGQDVDPAWANMVINSPTGRRYVKSVASQQVGQANVNGTKLKAFPLPLPPPDEQRRRVRAHDEVVASRERLRDQIAESTLRAANLRRSLLTAAFSGRLTNSSSEQLEELESV